MKRFTMTCATCASSCLLLMFVAIAHLSADSISATDLILGSTPEAGVEQVDSIQRWTKQALQASNESPTSLQTELLDFHKLPAFTTTTQRRQLHGQKENSVVTKTASLIADLRANTTKPRLTCVFHIIGQPSNDELEADSIPLQDDTIGLQYAQIHCRNGTLKLYGGSLLFPAAGNTTVFTGVDLIDDFSLPGANMRIEDQEVHIVNSSFKDLTSHGNAVLEFVGSTAVIESTVFANNVQAQSGGLMASHGTHLTVRQSDFMNNTGYEVGAIALRNSSAFIDHNTFVSNTGNQGGAILTQADSKNLNVHISWNILAGNKASNGGAIFIEGGRMAVLFGNELYKNKASTNGGAIFILKAPPIIVKNNITENEARYGGGAYVNEAPLLTSEENVWHKNSAGVEGGCLSIQNVPNAVLYLEAFSTCSSEKGGAILSTKSRSRISRCGFRGNRANKGGAVFRRIDQGSIEDSFFDRNLAIGPGGIGGALYDLMVTGDVSRTNFTRNAADDLAAQAFRVKCKGKLLNNNGIRAGAWRNAEFEVPLAGHG